MAASTELFAARGLSDVSMAEVARAAGVTKAALYYHFTDKADLYTRVALQRIEDIRAAMEEAIAAGGSLEDRLIRLAMVGFERLEADVYQPHLHAHEHLDEASHQLLHRGMQSLQEPVVRCFEEAGQPDSLLAPNVAATLLGGIMFSLIFAGGDPTASESPLPKDQRERAELAIRLFLRGYWSLARGDAAPG